MSLDLTKYRTERSIDFSAPPPAGITTGSFLFDYITGVGGLPRGRIVEAFGPEASGKSTSMYQAIAQVQRQGGIGLLLDYENAFIPLYAEQVGIDPDPKTFLPEVPLTLEQGFEMAADLTKAAADTNTPLIVVFDSLAAMPLESETAADNPSENNMGAAWRARAIKAYLRANAGHISRAGAVWVFINHEMDVIDTQAGPRRFGPAPTTTPGGKSLKFYASLRLQFRPGQRFKGEVLNPVTGELVEGYVATKTKITAVKNKVATPFRFAEVFIRYGVGIDDHYSIFEVGVARKVIKKLTQSKYELPDGRTIVGGNSVIEYLRTNTEASGELRKTLVGMIEADAAQQLVRLTARPAGDVTEADEEEPD